eukprot:359979-Chlamydomonas_euryale.AAC.1
MARLASLKVWRRQLNACTRAQGSSSSSAPRRLPRSSGGSSGGAAEAAVAVDAGCSCWCGACAGTGCAWAGCSPGCCWSWCWWCGLWRCCCCSCCGGEANASAAARFSGVVCGRAMQGGTPPPLPPPPPVPLPPLLWLLQLSSVARSRSACIAAGRSFLGVLKGSDCGRKSSDHRRPGKCVFKGLCNTQGWPAGWLAGGLAGWLAGGLTSWLAGWREGWLAG